MPLNKGLLFQKLTFSIFLKHIIRYIEKFCKDFFSHYQKKFASNQNFVDDCGVKIFY